MKKGRTLYRVTFDSFSAPVLEKWAVSSVQKVPRRYRWASSIAPRGPGGPTRVYLRRAKGSTSFPLSQWPNRYCEGFAATERAAWRKAIPRIRDNLKRYEEWQRMDDGDDDYDWSPELRQLRFNLTRATNKANP